MFQLIVASILSMNAPSPSISVISLPSKSSCMAAMDAAAEGAGKIYEANAMGAHREIKLEKEEGWTVVKSGLGREIARMKCVPS